MATAPASSGSTLGGCVVFIIAAVVLVKCMSGASDTKPEPPATTVSVAPSAPLQPAIVGIELRKAADILAPSLEKIVEPELVSSAPLFVKSWNWGEEYSFAIAEGTVRNTTSVPIENLEAVVEFVDGSGDLVKSASAMVEYDP